MGALHRWWIQGIRYRQTSSQSEKRCRRGQKGGQPRQEIETRPGRATHSPLQLANQ